MEGGSCDFESKADQGHGNAGKKQWGQSLRVELVRNGCKTGAACHSVDEAESEKRKSTGGTAKKKIFQPGFGRPNVAFVKRGHQIKRQPGKLEPNEDHQQLLAANEK